MSKEKYTISEMADLLGVTTHMLRHYEKMGIIQPDVNPENGYRLYSVLDTRRFNLSREFLACGIPLEQCARLMSNMGPDEARDTFDRAIQAQKRQIELSRIAIRFMENLRRDFPRVEELVGKVWVENLKPMWRLNFSQKERALMTPALKAQQEQWLACLPAVYWASRMPRQALLKYQRGEVYYEYGLACYEQDALALGLEKTEDVETIPGGDYLLTVHEKRGQTPFEWHHIAPLMDYLREERITVFGDAYAHILASRQTAEGVVNYHRVMLKIYS